MGKDELRLRANWQTVSGAMAGKIETRIYSIFSYLFDGTSYRITNKPKEFSGVYDHFPLSAEEQKQVYNPDRAYTHGFQPDLSIENTETDKKIFVEIKRQDGWVEGLPRSAGRGNAHERLCKYFTPGLRKILGKESGIEQGLPFWVIFAGNITRDPCRVREITCWFDVYTDHFFFWRDQNPDSLCDHFIDKIIHLLD